MNETFVCVQDFSLNVYVQTVFLQAIDHFFSSMKGIAMTPSTHTLQLTPQHLPEIRGMLEMFGQAFDDADSYGSAPPSDAYLKALLGRDTFIAIAALDGARVAGGVAAYVLSKFEQERTEIYLYDLAVAAAYRRRGIATALTRHLQRIGQDMGAYVAFVQADHGDDPAIALYSQLGQREKVMHFDIAIPGR